MSIVQSYMPDSDSEDELPPGWEERATDDRLVCYVNHHENKTQWTHPRTGRTKRFRSEMPIGWEKHIDNKNNSIVFRNINTNQMSNVDPRLAFAVEEPPLNASNVRQRFDSSSTALQVLHGKDLSGKLAVVTGSNCGIGLETARSLLLHGCEVIFACRSRGSAEEAIANVVREKPSVENRCHFMELDLSSFNSVLKFMEEIKKTVRHIDFFILNAGVFALPYTVTEDGIETTFQVSHLSNFFLTLQLECMLDHRSRIIVLSSESHRFANLPSVNLTEQHLSPPSQKYWSAMAYNNAKLCNVLFAQELADLWKHRGVSVFAVHPGNMVSSNLQRNWWFYRLLFAVFRPFTKSLQQAAATTIYCATASELNGLTGYYFNNCYFGTTSKLAKNENLRRQLWNLSEQMIKRILDNMKK